jgi:hypothetical protein
MLESVTLMETSKEWETRIRCLEMDVEGKESTS